MLRIGPSAQALGPLFWWRACGARYTKQECNWLGVRVRAIVQETSKTDTDATGMGSQANYKS